MCRDMFPAFWEEAFKYFFDGQNLLSPVVHPHTDMALLPTMGKILSHGYLVSGFLPVRIAFPVLAGILLGQNAQIPNRILVETFADSLCSFEASIIRNCLHFPASVTCFPGETENSLIAVLSRYGCREIPTPQTLERVLIQILSYEFRIKPLAAVCSIRSGIPVVEQPFWQNKTVEELYAFYLSLSATPSKVFDLINEPLVMNPNEQRIFGYLQVYVGDMKPEPLRRFLRFTTGSFVMIAKAITVSFNTLTGLGCRPIAHTCSCCIELPSTYMSYTDFEEEFTAILADTEYSWQMHGI